MNALQTYFEETGDTQSALAARIGRAPSTLSRALRGERGVSLSLAREVSAGTGGKVTPQQFLDICFSAFDSHSVPAPPVETPAGAAPGGALLPAPPGLSEPQETPA